MVILFSAALLMDLLRPFNLNAKSSVKKYLTQKWKSLKRAAMVIFASDRLVLFVSLLIKVMFVQLMLGMFGVCHVVRASILTCHDVSGNGS